MRLTYFIFFASILSFYTNTSFGKDHSVLAEGEWYKLPITQTGIHKIDFTYLKTLGIDIEKINPRFIKLYGNRGGMLPQKNSIARADDLIENSIFIQGEEDDLFNENDYILFFAQGPDRIMYNTTTTHFYHEKNQYSDTSFYFLYLGSDPGKRISKQQTPIAPSTSIISTYTDYLFHETDSINLLHSGREWLGEVFDKKLMYLFNLDLPGLVDNKSIEFTSSVAASSFSPSNFAITINTKLVGKQLIQPIVDAPYTLKANENKTNFSYTPDNTTLTIRYTYDKQNDYRAKGYLNYFAIEAKRKIQLYNQATYIQYPNPKNEKLTFQIDYSSTTPLHIWDISDQKQIQEITYQPITTTTFLFTLENKTPLAQLALFTENNFPSPLQGYKIYNQDLHAITTPTLLIITTQSLAQEAERLAKWRLEHDAILASVITVDKIYNEFSSGAQDITAIRDFIKFLYKKNNQLKYILLLGSCSYNYKKIAPYIVPTYESRESFHPIYSYSSDDYIGFLEDHEGEWGEAPPENHTLDVGIGRIPVKSIKEAKDIIEKLITYTAKTNGDWKNTIAFIADDGDENTHTQDAEKIATKLDTLNPYLNIKKIYLDSYPQVTETYGQSAPLVNQAINTLVEKGCLIINYTGHGSEYGWANEKILDIPQITSWKNKDKLPLIITATCEFGRFDDPGLTSAGEKMILHPKGGAIGLITTTRPVFSNSNYLLLNQLYETLFDTENRLGDIIRKTKNKSFSGVINRNFSLLGDPSMKLASSKYNINLTTCNQHPFITTKDTLKAFKKIHFEGFIENTSTKTIPDFNGDLIVRIWDKTHSEKTKGDESTPFTFREREKIYQASGAIKNGKISFTCMIPSTINYAAGPGKITMYAFNDQKDARGFYQVLIGGKSAMTDQDTIPPQLHIYLNDTLFVSGNTVDENPTAYITLFDKNGISISQKLDQGITLEITNNKTGEKENTNITDYYFSDLNNYQLGRIILPLQKENGHYTFTVKAWDIYHNSQKESIDAFIKEKSFEIVETTAYPNPFNNTTTFTCTPYQNPIDITIDIFSSDGKYIKSISKKIDSEEDFITWDGTDHAGEKIKPGIYNCTIKLNSTKKPSQKTIKFNRLIFLQ